MSTNDDKAAEEYDAETDILRQKEIRMTPDTAKKDRYAIQTGAAGTWNILRLVNPGCADYEEGPYEEYYCSVCICASATTAVAIADALKEKHPNGDIV